MNLFGLGPLEIGLILLAVLLLFGPKRLPQLGKSIGKTMRAIREGVDGTAPEEASAKPEAAEDAVAKATAEEPAKPEAEEPKSTEE